MEKRVNQQYDISNISTWICLTFLIKLVEPVHQTVISEKNFHEAVIDTNNSSSSFALPNTMELHRICLQIIHLPNIVRPTWPLQRHGATSFYTATALYVTNPYLLQYYLGMHSTPPLHRLYNIIWICTVITTTFTSVTSSPLHYLPPLNLCHILYRLYP